MLLFILLPRDAMQARPMSSCGVCVSVRRLSVCPPRIREFCQKFKTNKHIFKIFSPSGSQAIQVYHTKWHGNIPTGNSPLAGASNAGRVGINRDSEPMSGCTACCQSCDRPGVINTAPLDHGPAI